MQADSTKPRAFSTYYSERSLPLEPRNEPLNQPASLIVPLMSTVLSLDFAEPIDAGR